MIKLLHKNLVKSSLFALVSLVLVFGYIFLATPEIAKAQANLGAQAEALFNVDWLPATDVTSGSFRQYGILTVDPGNVVNGNPDNRFESGSRVRIKLGSDFYTASFQMIATGGGQTVEVPTNIQGGSGVDFTHPAELPENQRRIGVTFGSLQEQTTYTTSLRLTVSDLIQSSPQGGFTYIEVGNAVEPEITQTTTLATGQGETPEASSIDLGGAVGFDAAIRHDDLECGITTLFTNCIIHFLYENIYAVTVGLLGMAANLFDLLISLAISSNVYRDSTFVISGWSIVRDISNIFFIFVLLVAAFRTIFGATDVQKTIKNVIIVALLINFSLFMVRVVIDSSNILAHLFYNRISITGANNTELPPEIVANNVGLQKNLSTGITAGLSVQNFLSGPGVTSFLEELGKNRGTLTTIIIFAIIVNLIAAWMFFKVGWMMLGRIIGLWLSMIFAPLAFILQLVPKAGNYIPNFSFQKWMQDLIQYALLAPVFLFFVYIIMLFINSNFLDGFLSTSNYEGFEKLIIITLSFLIIIGILKIATETAEKMSGEAGKAISGAASKAFGLAAGVAGGAALAGTGLLARQTLGRAAASVASSERLKEAETQGGLGGFAATRLRNIGKAGAKGSFDARSGVIGKSLTSGLDQLGVKVDFDNKTLGAISGGTATKKAAEGGFEKARKDASEARVKRSKELTTGPDTQLALDVYRAREETLRRKAAYDAIVSEFGTEHDLATEAAEEHNQAQQNLEAAEGRKKAVDTQRKLDYADTVENESWMRYAKTGASETADKIRKGEKNKLKQIEAILGTGGGAPGGGGGGATPGGGTPGTGTPGGGTPAGGGGGPTASTTQTPQGAAQQPLPGNNQNLEKVLKSTKPSSLESRGGVEISSGEGQRKEVAGFDQQRRADAGLPTNSSEAKKVKEEERKEERRSEARKNLADNKTEKAPEEPKTRTEYKTVEVETKPQEVVFDMKGVTESMENLGENLNEKLGENLTNLESTTKEAGEGIEKNISESGADVAKAIEKMDQNEAHRDLRQRKLSQKEISVEQNNNKQDPPEIRPAA